MKGYNTIFVSTAASPPGGAFKLTEDFVYYKKKTKETHWHIQIFIYFSLKERKRMSLKSQSIV